ncbi:DUF2334 domain-containing protein [Candidatus Woesearchaeota archaeon]|jgi:hypothetical protein|nr:DUF2334 domain-containing protein [Candidatus Woesearchaeota archaeon]MBT7367630.1 DUF2334 domain-containing protein [Candidatus Woesearchaeota archaeon]
MKLIIRDDDLSYFAKPEDLERIYAGIWNKCPISFSTVPFVTTTGFETPLNSLKTNKLFGIGDNKKLVLFLKKKIKEGKITIVQHGYSHNNYGTKFELEQTDKKKLYKELKKGKKYLEKVFGIEINCLVAPHDRFSKQAIKIAEKIGYKYICRAFAPLPREIQLRKNYLTAFFKLFKHWLKYRRKYRYPTLLNYGTCKEIYSYRPNELITNIDSILKFHAKHEQSMLCLTSHYRSANIHSDELMKFLIKKIKKYAHLNKI